MSKPLAALKTDLQVAFQPDGSIDLVLSAGRLDRVQGLDNLAQALTLRLLTQEGELSLLGHRRYGSRVRDFIGERLDRPNLELLRRRVRHCLKSDPRVKEVLRVTVSARALNPGVVDVDALVQAITGEEVAVSLVADLA